MNALWLTVYMLVWPVIVAGTLVYIARAFFSEWRQARRDGNRMI